MSRKIVGATVGTPRNPDHIKELIEKEKPDAVLYTPQTLDVDQQTQARENINAMSADTSIPEIPTNVSAFANDVGYLTESNVFIAEYGVATFAEIDDALKAGKEVVVRKDNKYYQYSHSSNTSLTFCYVDSTGYKLQMVSITQAENRWVESANSLQVVNRMVQEVTTSNKNSIAQYPSLKALTSYAVPIPASATIGQTIKVSAVDDNGKPTAWEAVDIPSVLVQSVNGKTGEIELTAEDVGALPDTTTIPTVPTNVSAFANDAGYLTESNVFIAEYGVSTFKEVDDAYKAGKIILGSENINGIYSLYLLSASNVNTYVFTAAKASAIRSITLSELVGWIPAVSKFFEISSNKISTVTDDDKNSSDEYPSVQALTSYAVPIPSSISVGQIVKVSAVDENGVPTAWEAVDIPASYTLPPATADTLGGVMVGDGLTVDSNGVMGVVPEGELELIDTFTYSIQPGRPTAAVKDVDLNGVAYAFDALIVKVRVDVGEAVPNALSIGMFNESGENITTYVVNTDAMVVNSTNYIKVRVYKNIGVWMIHRSPVMKLAGGYFDYYVNDVFDGVKATRTSYISQFKISAFGAASEAEITIEGVRHRA